MDDLILLSYPKIRKVLQYTPVFEILSNVQWAKIYMMKFRAVDQ
jgi:hypothetical protein